MDKTHTYSIKFRQIDQHFKGLKLLTYVSVGLCAIICITTIALSFWLIGEERKKIYVSTREGTLIMALANDLHQNRPAEAKAHVKQFHRLFFNLSPDAKAIEENLREALNLCDQSARKQHLSLIENGYYSRLIAGDVSQKLKVDSITLSDSNLPWKATFYGTLIIIRPTAISKRRLITKCRLRDLARSEDNPQGFLMENWEVLENKEIETQKRI